MTSRLRRRQAAARRRQPAAAAPSQTPDFFKNSTRFKAVPLAPSRLAPIDKSWTSVRKRIAGAYNRVGGVIGALAADLSIENSAVLAIWYVESGGRAHTVNRAIIRFENHLLFRAWGTAHPALYDRHFQYGGHAGVSGKPWQNHAFRESADGAFVAFHGNQDLEYRALALAARLAGADIALQCISIGGPQILVSNYRSLGYESPREMHDAFQASERYHVLGFFDFCRSRNAPARGDLLRYLREKNWASFARYYNGPGQVDFYAGHIQNAYDHARSLLAQTS
jgi:hypothetical protein